MIASPSGPGPGFDIFVDIVIDNGVGVPGDVTPYHSHRHPVTVYMLEGIFTLALDGRTPVEISAGEVFIEPAGVAMTGRNDGKTPARMALFYVCVPDAPFADVVPHDEQAG